MLWDLIRDFFVQHVFGGTDRLGNYYETFGGYLTSVNVSTGKVDEGYTGSISSFMFKIGDTIDGYVNYVNMADWLSTTATAISITIIVVLCCLFVYKIIKLIGGLIR